MKHSKIYKDGKYVAQRMCIACRTVKPKEELIRVFLEDGIVSVDCDGKGQGRGCYVCKKRECVEKAQKIRGFERGLKTNISASVYEECIKFVE